jgi:hypothetical protein
MWGWKAVNNKNPCLLKHDEKPVIADNLRQYCSASVNLDAILSPVYPGIKPFV